MKSILREDIPTLQKGETAICIDSLSIIKYTLFEGIKEQSLKDVTKIPVEILQEIKQFLNETYQDVNWIFTVTFNNQTAITNVSIPNNNKVTKPADPTKTGYTFAGWLLNGSVFDFYTLITANITLTASFTAVEYNITYVLNDGTNGANPSTFEITDVPVTLLPATKAGFEFDGWFEDAELLTPIVLNQLVAGADITVYAGFTELFTVTYDLNGGNIDASEADVVVTNVRSGDLVGSAYTGGVPVLADNTWTTPYWVTAADGSTDAASEAVTADITVYAYYTVN